MDVLDLEGAVPCQGAVKWSKHTPMLVFTRYNVTTGWSTIARIDQPDDPPYEIDEEKSLPSGYDFGLFGRTSWDYVSSGFGNDYVLILSARPLALFRINVQTLEPVGDPLPLSGTSCMGRVVVNPVRWNWVCNYTYIAYADGEGNAAVCKVDLRSFTVAEARSYPGYSALFFTSLVFLDYNLYLTAIDSDTWNLVILKIDMDSLELLDVIQLGIGTDWASMAASEPVRPRWEPGRLFLCTPDREEIFIVDEASRFTTDCLRDMLQSLRKYRVFMILASQYLDQYIPVVRDSILALCGTVISFSTNKDTASKMEELFTPSYTYRHIMDPPRHRFIASSIIDGRREAEWFKTVDVGWGPYKPEEIILASLSKYGRPVKPFERREEMPSGKALSTTHSITRRARRSLLAQLRESQK